MVVELLFIHLTAMPFNSLASPHATTPFSGTEPSSSSSAEPEESFQVRGDAGQRGAHAGGGWRAAGLQRPQAGAPLRRSAHGSAPAHLDER
eukprot:2608816-Rhodomonas_salina.3